MVAVVVAVVGAVAEAICESTREEAVGDSTREEATAEDAVEAVSSRRRKRLLDAGEIDGLLEGLACVCERRSGGKVSFRTRVYMCDTLYTHSSHLLLLTRSVGHPQVDGW